MGWLNTVKKGIQKFNLYIAGIGGVFLIPLMVVTATDVVSRDIFNRPIPGVVESSEYLLSIIILLGLAYAQQVKAHVGVSIITSRLPHHGQLVLSIIATFICLFISSILVWQGSKMGMEERTVSDMLRIPQYPFKLLVGVGGFLLCLELLIDLVDTITKLLKR